MEKVQNLKSSNTAPSLKTFRDEKLTLTDSNKIESIQRTFTSLWHIFFFSLTFYVFMIRF
jgi:hypothetical protein